MILTNYYKLKRLPEYYNNKTPRFDCVASTHDYPPFEGMAARSKVKRFFCYYNGLPDTFSDRARNKAERVITNKKNISSVYIPDMLHPLFGYGDVKGTQDAILFAFKADYSEFEVFIAGGYKSNKKRLYSLLMSGELNNDVERLRLQAVATVE